MSRRRLVRIIGTAVAVLMVTAGGIWTLGVDDKQDTLVGLFADASPLDPGSEVRLAGARVGNVDAIQLENGHARVTFTVDTSVLPVHRDARLVIRPVNVLGERYVQLEPGSPSEPHLQPAVVPLQRTSSRVSLEDVLNTFDDPTSTALAAIVTSLGEGVADSGGEAAAAIKALAPAMRDTKELSGVLADQNTVLTQLLDRIRPVAHAVTGKNGNRIDQLIGSTERMLSTVAANRRALNDTVAELPGTLRSARRTLATLAGVAEETTPALESMRPITEDLTDISAELHRFASAADPALASLEPVLDHADELLSQARPVVAQLRQAGPDLRDTARGVRPLGDVLLDRHLGDVMAFVKKWALATNERDALSHYFRGAVLYTPETIRDLLASPILPKDTDVGASKKAPRLPVPGKTPLPDLKLPPAPESDSATGLNKQQEQSMLGQLLGGSDA